MIQSKFKSTEQGEAEDEAKNDRIYASWWGFGSECFRRRTS